MSITRSLKRRISKLETPGDATHELQFLIVTSEGSMSEGNMSEGNMQHAENVYHN
jgi:hypothetical protein